MSNSNIKMMDLYSDSPWFRLLFKAPLIFWRLGLGPILGKFMVVMTTTGRKSGLPRHTMVEYRKFNGQKYVVCAFGEQSDWYKNILAQPNITIQTSDGIESVQAVRTMEDHELLAAYDAFRRGSQPLMDWYLESLGIPPTIDGLLANKEKLHILRFDPVDVKTPPALVVDLAWLWPLALILLLPLKLNHRRRLDRK
jgi:deazaflavin-dependent oxidoreductase (nitroreductase family)